MGLIMKPFQRLYVATCDTCGNEGTYDANTYSLASMEDLLTCKGWKLTPEDDGVTCSECRWGATH